MSRTHSEWHRTERIGWLRATVLGANDGIVSTASLVLGVAASHATRGSLLVAGGAGLVAGAWQRLHFTADLAPAQIEGLVVDAQAAGFLPDAIPLDRLFSGKP